MKEKISCEKKQTTEPYVLAVKVAEAGLYRGYSQAVSIGSKFLVLLVVLWAVYDPVQAGQQLKAMSAWSFKNLNAYYTYAVAFFILLCIMLAIHPRWGSIKLGAGDAQPEFSNFSWFSMMFGAGIGIGMLGYAAAEPIWHLSNNPDIIASREIVAKTLSQAGLFTGEQTNTKSVFQAYRQAIAQGTLSPINDVIIPKSASALDSVYRYTFFHWGLSAWACYALVGLCLAYACYTQGHPLTIRSTITPLLGKRLQGNLGHCVDIAAVLATILGVAQTVGLGLKSFTSGLHNITGASWLMTTDANPQPTNAALLMALLVVMMLSMLSALSGVGRGIKWLSNLNIVLSFALLGLFLLFGATWFAFELLGIGMFQYLLQLPSMTLTVWDSASESGQWQSNWSIFYWAWWVAFSPFVGMFLARISKNRTIREFIVGAILAPSLMCFIWFAVVGGTAIDLELSGQAHGEIFSANLTYQLYEVVNTLFSQTNADLISIMIVVLLLTYLVTSVDSAVLVVNTINAGGENRTGHHHRLHIILWSVLLTLMIFVLLLAGGINTIKSAMIVGAVPFSVLMILMGIGLIKSLLLDRRINPT